MEPVFFSSTLVIFAQLLLAGFLGMVIGTERSVVADKQAGTRTYALVALGSCLFTAIGIFVTTNYLGLVNFDPMRIPSAIITGIGFIGAGLIIFRDNKLEGLTTAAGLWVASGIGIAVAFKLYAIAIFTTVAILLIFTLLWFVEHRLDAFLEKHSRLKVVRERDLEDIEK